MIARRRRLRPAGSNSVGARRSCATMLTLSSTTCMNVATDILIETVLDYTLIRQLDLMFLEAMENGTAPGSFNEPGCHHVPETQSAMPDKDSDVLTKRLYFIIKAKELLPAVHSDEQALSFDMEHLTWP